MDTSLFWVLALVFLEVNAEKELGRRAWKCAFDLGTNVFELSGESLSSEEDDAFGSCSCFHHDGGDGISWTKLDCSRRGFTSIASDTLPNRICSLDLSQNHIRFLKKGIFDTSFQMTELLLRNNGLIKIGPGAFDELASLMSLDLSENYLLQLSESIFARLTALRVLNLSRNGLLRLPPALFSNIKLDSLSLSGNSEIGSYIFDAPDALKDLLRRGLRRLNLSATNLTNLPENLFTEAFALQELDIANNAFPKLPHLYIGSLQVLNISRANISLLEIGSFLTLPNLKILRMDHLLNLVTVEEGAFVGLKNLHTLSLERCYNLTKFSGLAFGGTSSTVPSLHVLNLRYGGLETLSKKLLPFVSKIPRLNLEGNPWNCDCRLKWLKDVKFSKEKEAHLLCYSPSNLHNQTIESVDISKFVCMTKTGRMIYGIVVSMAVIFTIVTLLLILAYFDMTRRRQIGEMMGSRVQYDPMMVQLHPYRENHWDDEGDSSISFIRGNRML